MRLIGRTSVEGTEPRIHIGHRVRHDPRTGKELACRPWYAEWSEYGIKRYEALKTPNKQIAIRRAHEICRRISDGELAKPKLVALEHLVEQYLSMLRAQGRAPKTIGKYQHVLERKLLPWAQQHGIRNALSLREMHFWAFSESLSYLAEKTRYTELTIVKQLIRWAHREGLVAENPIARCRLTEPEPTEQHCFTPGQVEQMIEAANGYLRPIIRFLALSGCRFGEARDLEWGDIDFDSGTNGFLNIRRGGSRGRTKTGRSRRIPMHPDLRSELKSLSRIPGSDRVFHALPTTQHPELDRPLVERRLLFSVKRLAKQCGFKDWKKARIHSLRHHFASELVRSGVTEFTALSLMGHRSSDVLAAYLHPHDDDAERAIALLNGVKSQKSHKFDPNPDN